MRFGNNSPEKLGPGHMDFYIKVFIYSILAGLALILTLKILGLIFNFVVNYWYWAIGALLLSLLIKKIFFRKKRERIDEHTNKQI